MTSDFTAGFLLLWDLAALEAQAGTHDGIRPEHFFIALCKADEIPVGALRDDGTPTLRKQIPIIEKELRAVRSVFDAAGFDRKAARRARARAAWAAGEATCRCAMAPHTGRPLVL